MTQTAAILTRCGAIHIELPSANVKLMKDVLWGSVDAFPTPAYWTYQVLVRRLLDKRTEFRLGRTLTEEVGACLLGGHGIPATVGLAAYARMRERGIFEDKSPCEATLTALLREPLTINGRSIHYRFAAQKAKYLATAIPLAQSAPNFTTGRELRDWLLRARGVGPKTASWVARNWLGADDVAILDIHIMRVGQAMGIFPRELTVERHYLELEERFVRFSELLDVRASELDAVIWDEMASSPATVARLMEHLRAKPSPRQTRRSTVPREQAELLQEA